jgi:hypothetical protein
MKKDIQEKHLKVSDVEKELLSEIIKSEKANLRFFPLPNRKEQVKYEKILGQLCSKFA